MWTPEIKIFTMIVSTLLSVYTIMSGIMIQYDLMLNSKLNTVAVYIRFLTIITITILTYFALSAGSK